MFCSVLGFAQKNRPQKLFISQAITDYGDSEFEKYQEI